MLLLPLLLLRENAVSSHLDLCVAFLVSFFRQLSRSCHVIQILYSLSSTPAHGRVGCVHVAACVSAGVRALWYIYRFTAQILTPHSHAQPPLGCTCACELT